MHEPGLDTLTVVGPPAAPTVTAVLDTWNVHSTAVCDTVSVFPAMFIVPVRAAPVLAATA